MRQPRPQVNGVPVTVLQDDADGRRGTSIVESVARERRFAVHEHLDDANIGLLQQVGAFSTLSLMTAASGNRRADVSAPFEAKRRRAQALISEVARVLGLSDQMKRAAATTHIPIPETMLRPTLVIGSYGDRLNQQR